MFTTKLCFQLVGAQFVLLHPSEVLFLEADRQVCNINLADGNRLVAVRHIGYYKQVLVDKFQFLELSKSVVVNSGHVIKYSPRERLVQLSSGHSLSISKSRQEYLNKVFRQCHEDWAKSKTASEFKNSLIGLEVLI